VIVQDRKYLSTSELSALLGRFPDHWSCWKVGLRYGSCVYFEMGDRLREELRDGEFVDSGSASLTLEGYDWKIYRASRQVADARSITGENTRTVLAQLFIGRKLERLTFSSHRKELVATFSPNLLIRSQRQESENASLCILVVPNGYVLGCDPELGFFWDYSISKPHAIYDLNPRKRFRM